MSKKILFLIVLINLFAVTNIALSEIIPLKKPIQTKEETQKKLLIDFLKPLPKPIEKSEVEPVQEKTVAIIEKKKRPILPKKKTFSSRISKNFRS